MQGAEPIVLSLECSIPPEQAWAAFVEHFAEWWPAATHSLSRNATARCLLDARPGGALEECTDDGSRVRWGTVQSAETGHRLRLTWHPGREAETAQWIEVVFARTSGGSRLTLTHGGWEALGEVAPILRREYATGWREVLDTHFAAYLASCR